MTIDNVHIRQFEPLATPEEIRVDIPMSSAAQETVTEARQQIRNLIQGKDRRLLVIVGPCSVHDTKAAYEYATQLKELRSQVSENLLLVMRVYFEKPRTTVGWKGLINDPHLDESFDVALGLRKAREILNEINGMGVPCASEFLDPIVPQYTAEFISWAAIGARTTESQTHREMASGLSMPVGFKNATDGSLDVAVNAMVSARQSHAFLGIDRSGRSAIVRTTGNDATHIVLRGGQDGPNYRADSIVTTREGLRRFGDKDRLIMVDCSHGNSDKDYRRQPDVFRDVISTFRSGEDKILGLMLESNLVAGRQDLGKNLVYGQSVTDGCIDWNSTRDLLLSV